jgi:hypothetical protein
MSKNMNSKKSRPDLTDVMMVIVNREWWRAYVASIKIVNTEKGIKKYAAKCELKNTAIISSAYDKSQLSTNMDELATISEDRISREIPAGTPVIAGANYFLN